ncbi:hypothetical protein JCM19046_1104 [Bacillus sp. JCM 19046]|uniref:Cell division protein FtsW (Lipid II flippase) n=1 Tax=Shouchella xiaoxiensis TaxID=766895 RepID=A0ABS2SXW6_9BACI|nr:hypothetical protein [Shouchella xiaoxiensis]MBM7840379.1 cell division protein FtsW (lipid II flippase) [Shouchella xiaoxiensis]GAF13597.1 hypothetical protein JCM19045_2850 [Bacillus sp. JCM 19045]GAF16654.1 hypothetical protein JCM19046_1104 [Bacillus sp. JCM 19046]
MKKLEFSQLIACTVFLLFVVFLQDIPYSILWFSLLLGINIALFVIRKKKQKQST